MSKQSKLKRKKLEEFKKIQELNYILKDTKHKHRRPYQLLEKIRDGVVTSNDLAHNSGAHKVARILEREINRGVRKPEEYKPNRKMLYYLLKIWQKRIGDKVWDDDQVIDGLIQVANHCKLWIRELKTWKARGNNTRKLFSKLLRHLFAKYSVPQFLDQVWFTNEDVKIGWFLDIAQGKNIRKSEALPLKLTKKMAHHFLQAPPHYSMTQAFRRGQVLGLGGNKKLAKQITASRLGKDLEQDDFWKSVIQFFINYTNVNYGRMNAMIDYIQSQKFGFYRVVDQAMGYHVISIPAENPDFNIQGRTLKSLIRAMEERVNITGELIVRWKPFEVADFEYIQKTETGEVKTYRIRQLISNDQIEREGASMHHCVSTYITECIEGKTSIWSMTVENSQGKVKRLLTIELDNDLEIRQALRKCNMVPKPEELRILRLWANANKLCIPGDIND